MMASMTAEQSAEETVRTELLARVEEVREVLTRTASQSEQTGHLASEAVTALKDAGLLQIKVAHQAGGMEATPATQFLVLSAIAEIDAAAAWNVMVNNNSAGFMSSFLPQEGFDEVFSDGIPVAAGVAAPTGTLRQVEGGWVLSGRWKMCSGVNQASWVRVQGMREDGAGPMFVVIPKTQATVHFDSWSVFGLRGTGSYDVSASDVFIPDRRVMPELIRYRGSAQYKLKGLAASSYEHSAIPLGLGLRAMNELTRYAAGKTWQRALSGDEPGAALLAQSNSAPEALLSDLGRHTASLRALKAAALAHYEATFRAASREDADLVEYGLMGMTIATLATDAGYDAIEVAYRHAGSAGLYTPNPFERLVRDMHGATQHIAVSRANYRDLGQRLIDNAKTPAPQG